MNNFSMSPNGYALTKSFESCRLKAYQDSGGVWTIGWGHTGPDVREDLIWTQDYADRILQHDMIFSEVSVQTYVTATLTQNQFDALCDFVFNLGLGTFKRSEMLKMINAKDFAGAVKQFERFDHVGKNVVAGLLRRRQAEAALFNS